MADANVLKNNFNKAELLELAQGFNLELVLNGEPVTEENTNAEISEAIAALVTPEQAEKAVKDKKLAKAASQYEEHTTDGVVYSFDVTEPDAPIFARYEDFENLQESPAGFGTTDAEALAELQADADRDRTPTPPVDPALAGADDEVEDDTVVADQLEVGDKVYYPHKESFGGLRRGRVTDIEGETVTVTYVDGTTRSFGANVLKKA